MHIRRCNNRESKGVISCYACVGVELTTRDLGLLGPLAGTIRLVSKFTDLPG